MQNTHNTPSPSDGFLWNFDSLPRPVRVLVGVLALAFLLLICSAPKTADASPAKRPPVTFSAPCRVVVTDADHDTGKLDRIAARHGGVDYIGGNPGRWTLNDTGKVFGYSAQEDGIHLQHRPMRPHRPHLPPLSEPLPNVRQAAPRGRFAASRGLEGRPSRSTRLGKGSAAGPRRMGRKTYANRLTPVAL